jgi:A/G-specific adenine glycosylase
MPDFYFNPAEVARRLLAWYGRAGRDLPWRRTRDPYRIWLSEVMLQQTGVESVIPYYERFLEAFPTVLALAAASVEEVVERWAGLGYYSRARNLHAAAQRVVNFNAGHFPDTLEGLMELPGVGRSTAGAILSIAFDRPGPILDGNVRRVLCRLHALKEDPRSGSGEKKLWAWAAELTPIDRPHDYAQAIMDLGATVCTPRSPECGACPLQTCCRARSFGLEKELPLRSGGKKAPTRVQVALLLFSQGRCLVRRRPLSGMLGGLWEFPAAAVSEGETPGMAACRLLQIMGLASEPRPAGEVAHIYSHFRLDLRLYRAEAEQTFNVAEGEETRWILLSELAAWPLHGAHKKALALLSIGEK